MRPVFEKCYFCGETINIASDVYYQAAVNYKLGKIMTHVVICLKCKTQECSIVLVKID